MRLNTGHAESADSKQKGKQHEDKTDFTRGTLGRTHRDRVDMKGNQIKQRTKKYE